jgi:hypothetical protein
MENMGHGLRSGGAYAPEGWALRSDRVITNIRRTVHGVRRSPLFSRLPAEQVRLPKSLILDQKKESFRTQL